jgi:hypothetical protein
MRLFLHKLNELVRLGDTRALELVIGLMAICLGIQFLSAALNAKDDYTTLTHPMILGTIGIMATVGGITKTLGAVMEYTPFRTKAALLVATTWIYLIVVYVMRVSIPSTLIFTVLAAQSIWIYIRLSILSKQGKV